VPQCPIAGDANMCTEKYKVLVSRRLEDKEIRLGLDNLTVLRILRLFASITIKYFDRSCLVRPMESNNYVILAMLTIDWHRALYTVTSNHL